MTDGLNSLDLASWKVKLIKAYWWVVGTAMILGSYGMMSWFIPSIRYGQAVYWPAAVLMPTLFFGLFWVINQLTVKERLDNLKPIARRLYFPIGKLVFAAMFAWFGYSATHYGVPAALSHFTGAPAKVVFTVVARWRDTHRRDYRCMNYGLEVYNQNWGQWRVCVFAKTALKTEPGKLVQLTGSQSYFGFRYDSNKAVVLDAAKTGD